jgi:hypothetical protein
MKNSILLLCPGSPDDVWCREEHLFFRLGVDREVTKRLNGDFLPRFLRIVDEKTAFAFARTYGPIQPMRACGLDPETGLTSHSVKSAINQAERLRQIRSSPRDATWKRSDYYNAVSYLQGLMQYCNLRPAVVFDEERGTYRTSLTDQPAIPCPEALNILTCGLSAVIYFMMEEFAGRQGEEVHIAKCAACGRNFEADRLPSPDRRSWCPSCRGTARQWATIKRYQRDTLGRGERGSKTLNER